METKDITQPYNEAMDMLNKYGYRPSTRIDELVRWFECDTPNPDIGLEAVIKNRYLVAHELIEIDEVKRKGLKLTKDVILKNPTKVDAAHLRAAEIEIEIAERERDYSHIKQRYRHIKGWSEEPNMPESLRAQYADFYRHVTDILRKAAGNP